MSKILRVAAVVVAVAAITIATAGIGTAPAVSAASTTLAIGGTAFTTAGFAVAATGASILGISAATLTTIAGGLSLAASLTAKKPVIGSAGTQTQFKADPDAPIPYAIGRTFVAGNIVHQASSGSNNELLHFALVWSGAGPIDSFEAFKVDGATVTFGAGGAATGGYAGFMWLKTQLGAAPEAAALSPGSGAMPGWGATSKLSGYAAGLWTLKYDKKGKVFAAGVPKVGMVGKWVRVYDPRKDSTYPGGLGAHRPLVESTYEWSENPWLHALTWAMGRLQNGQFVLGARQKFDSIDVAAFVEAANVAQANGWTCGGQVTSADDPWQVLKAMCQAGGGEPIRIGAQLSCIVSTPRVSLGTITAADLAAPVKATATQPRRDRINGVIGKYRSEAHDWEIVSAAPVRIDSYVTFDGRRRTREVTYALVQNVAQVAQLAAYDVYNARELPAIVTPLKIRFVGVKPGDCWTLHIPEAGLNAQDCILRGRALDVAKGVPTLSWRSETASKHAAALGKTTTPPPTPTLGLVDLSSVPAPGAAAWSATGTTLTANGVSVPAIAISGAVDNPRAEAVIFEYGSSAAGPWNNASTEDASVSDFTLASVTSGTDYYIAVSYRVRNVVGSRLVLGPVTTGSWEGTEGPAGASSFHLEDVTNGDLGAPGTWTKRPTSAGDWDGLVKTVESYVGAAAVTCDYGTDIFVGLSTDYLYDYPTEDCFNRLDYVLHISGDGNTAVYRNGVLTSTLGPNQPGQKPLVWSDDNNVYYACGTLSYSHPVNAPGERLFGVFAMYYPGQTMTGIGFSAAGAAGVNAKHLYLDPTGEVFRYDKDGAIYPDQSIRITIRAQNLTDTTCVVRAYRLNADGSETQIDSGGLVTTSFNGFVDNDPDPNSFRQNLDFVDVGGSYFAPLLGAGQGMIVEVISDGITTRQILKAVQDGAAGLTISADEPLLTVARTASGVIKSLQLPQTVHLQVLSGDVDVTADTTFSDATGTNATASNDGGGAYTLTSVSSATKASFKITATYAGKSIDYTVPIAQPQDGASASRQSADLGAPASGGSYVQIGSVDLVVANGATINASGSLNYAAVDNGVGTRTVTLNAYVDIYNLTDTGTPVNGSAEGGTQSSFIHGDGLSEVGSVSAGASMTNSSGAPKTFRARFYTAKASGNSTADTTAGSYSGSIEITAS